MIPDWEQATAHDRDWHTRRRRRLLPGGGPDVVMVMSSA